MNSDKDPGQPLTVVQVNVDQPRRRRAPNGTTEEIVVERVWCRQCGETRRSFLHRSGFKEQGDGSCRCFVDCRTCGNRFKVIEEISI